MARPNPNRWAVLALLGVAQLMVVLDATVVNVALAASVVLLVALVRIEARAAHPLLPLHIVADRARGGAFASIGLAGSGLFGVFLFLTYYMQQSLGFSPLDTGLAFLPMTIAIVITSTTVPTQVLHRVGARPLVCTGMALGVISLVSFTRLAPGSGYATHVLPGLILVGLGMGCVFAPAFGTATLGVPTGEAGVASATVNTAQQVGGSVGTALLSTIFASAAAAYAAGHVRSAGLANAAAIHGYTTAFWWAAAIFAVGFLVARTVLPAGVARRSPELAAAGAG